MIRITFQFMPVSFSNTDPIELKGKYRKSGISDSSSTGITTIEQQNSRIDVAANGSIRYSVEVETLNENVIYETYSDATKALNEVTKTNDQYYRISIIIANLDTFDQYYKNRQLISEFGSTKLETDNPKYTELSEDTVKISFGNSSRKVTV